MRIVAGEFRGRRLQTPRGDTTRPTTDRVREALFSSLSSIAGADLGGGRGLDAFAGSGALGLEALSRGLGAVTFLERDRAALASLRANIEALGVNERAFVVQGDALNLASTGAIGHGPFSLLLIDPPYRLACNEIARMISALLARDLLEDGALIVYEHSVGNEVSWPSGVTELAEKRYGLTHVRIALYEKEAGSL
jgi:16S rRNA (guanine966-N2)-methyltransferase